MCLTMVRGDRKKHKKDLETFRLELDDELHGNNVETSSRTTLLSTSSPATMDSIEPEAPDLPDDDEDSDGELLESDPEPPVPVGGKKFFEVGESSESGNKRKRGRGAGLVSDDIIRLTNGKIRIEWDKAKNGPHDKQVDIMLSHDIGVAVRENITMEFGHWSKVKRVEFKRVLDYVKNKYTLDVKDKNWYDYIYKMCGSRFREWKHECHEYWKVHRKRVPSQFVHRRRQWHWLHKHFKTPKFQEASRRNSSNRSHLVSHHHAGSTAFVHIQEEFRKNGDPDYLIQGFEKAYKGDRIGEENARKMKDRVAQLQEERASQNLNVPVKELGPLDINEQIEIFDEVLGERSGEVFCGGGRGIRRKRVKEKTSSNLSSVEAENSELKARIMVLEEKIESLSDVNIEQRFMEWMSKWNCRGQPPLGSRDDDMSSGGGSATGLGV